MTNRVAITWRGPRGVRRDRTETFTEFSEIVELLSPNTWTLACISLLDDAAFAGQRFLVWRLEPPQLRSRLCSKKAQREVPPKLKTVQELAKWCLEQPESDAFFSQVEQRFLCALSNLPETLVIKPGDKLLLLKLYQQFREALGL